MNPLFEDWKNEGHSKKESNHSTLKLVSQVPSSEFYPFLVETHKQTFTEIDCLQCANCCKTIPPIIVKTDIKRIAGILGLSKKQFIRKYILEDVDGEMTFNGVPCKFLESDNSCRIYDIRPEACRRYPHTDEKEFQKRVSFNIENTIICPAAFNIVGKINKHFLYDGL